MNDDRTRFGTTGWGFTGAKRSDTDREGDCLGFITREAAAVGEATGTNVGGNILLELGRGVNKDA